MMLNSDENILLRLEDIKPYDGDLLFKVDGMSADEYIQKLTEEMNKIEFDTIPFDKWDYIVTFSLALMEVAGDFFISDPKNPKSLAHTLSDKNSRLGSFMNDIHKKLDHSGQPLDYQGTHFGGGDHRVRTFAHDILMFPLAIYMLMNGKFVDGFYENGAFQKVVSSVNQFGNPYESLDFFDSIVGYATHMAADFFSSAGLPIPGYSILTHAPNREIRKFANDLYHDGLNMRNLLLQGVPVALTELGMWIYTGLRYNGSSYSKAMIQHKKNKLLLIAHGIASAVNIGKVIITKNPVSLNLIMIARTFHLIWKVTVEELSLTNKAITQEAMGVVKARIETMQTLILLDKTIYETNQYNRLIENINASIEQNIESEQHKMGKYRTQINIAKARINAQRGNKK